jgi:hypothetical protein
LILNILVVVLLSVGFYQFTGGSLHYPPRASVKAIEKLTGKKSTLRDRICFCLARRIEPLVHLSPYRKSRLQKELAAAGKTISPEFHTAIAIASAGLFLIAGLVMLPMVPFSSAGLFAYAVLRFFKLRKVKDSDEHRKKIEAETPRFTSYIVQSSTHRQAVPGMIQGYREIAGVALGAELDILLTDMRTKNNEAALIDFESRIDSTLVSELVRGLIGLEHGENMQAYLINVEARMNQHEIAALKREAEERPEKLTPVGWLLLASILGNVCVVYGNQLYQNFKLFGG